MALKQRIVTEIYDDQTQDIIHREVTEEKVIKSPKSIDDLGYNHFLFRHFSVNDILSLIIINLCYNALL